MAEKDLKVLGTWASPFVMRVRIALNIKSVDYEFLEEKLPAKSELLLKSNPVHQKVPVLIHGDNPICESLIIVEYIDEVWHSNPSILPADSYDRAIARFWAAFVDEKVFISIREIALLEDGYTNKAATARMGDEIMLLEEAFGKISKGKAFFGGDAIGFLDIVFGSILGWVRVTEKFSGAKLLHETKTPALCKWAERFSADAAVKGLELETEKLVEIAKLVQNKAASEAKLASASN